MRRIFLVLAVALVMAAMMAVTVTSAFAAGPQRFTCAELNGTHGLIVVTPQGPKGHCPDAE